MRLGDQIKVMFADLLSGESLLLLLLPAALLFLSGAASLLPPPLQLLQLLLGLDLTLPQLLQLLALLLLQPASDLLQTLLCLQDGLAVLGLSCSTGHMTQTVKYVGKCLRKHKLISIK